LSRVKKADACCTGFVFGPQTFQLSDLSAATRQTRSPSQASQIITQPRQLVKGEKVFLDEFLYFALDLFFIV
jgi:hypothetical protein